MLHRLLSLILRSLSRWLLLMSWACRRAHRSISSSPTSLTGMRSSQLSKTLPTKPKTAGSRQTSEPTLSRPEPPIWRQEPQHFLELELEELELAFEALANPEQFPPRELEHLTPEDWLCLESLLELLEEQRMYAPLH